jgi:hypothetical protein
MDVATRCDEVLIKSYTGAEVLSARFGEHFSGSGVLAYFPIRVDAIQSRSRAAVGSLGQGRCAQRQGFGPGLHEISLLFIKSAS